jgi:hypothetical protein
MVLIGVVEVDLRRQINREACGACSSLGDDRGASTEP